MANRALGLAAFAAATAGGVALGFLGERRVVSTGGTGPDPVRDALSRPARGTPCEVWSPDGTRLAAEVSGPPDAPVVLLVHGMGLGQEAWHYQRRDLEADHRVVTFDLRGHGGSDPAADDDYSAAALADDVVAVLQQTAPGSGRAVLVGHSLGGMSVLAALRHHPEVIRARAGAIGLVATAGTDVVGGVLRTGAAVTASVVRSALLRSGPARFVRRRLEEPRRDQPTDLSFVLTRIFGLSPSAPPGAVNFVDRLNRRVPAGVLGALATTLTTIDELDFLTYVDVPVTVVVGEEDRLTPPSQAEKIVGRLPDAELVRVPDAGHTVMVEQPEPVNAALRRLSSRSRRSS